jgi:hypothetical protein
MIIKQYNFVNFEHLNELKFPQMKEEDLLRAHHIGDVIDILQSTSRHLYDPDELLTVRFFSPQINLKH